MNEKDKAEAMELIAKWRKHIDAIEKLLCGDKLMHDLADNEQSRKFVEGRRRKTMGNEVMQEIVEFAANKLKTAYGYCGIASGEDMAILNSDDKNGNDISITFAVAPE